MDQNAFTHLKKLCRIECSPEEEVDVHNSLKRILEYMEQLNEVDTKNIKPCNYVLRSMLTNRLRKDEIGEKFPRDQFLSNAPDQIGGMIRVPPVLKPQ